MWPVIPALVALIICYYTFIVLKFLQKYHRQWVLSEALPGPKATYLIGNLLQIPSNEDDHADYYQALVKEYVDKGEDIVRLWFGPNLAVFPLNSDATKVITSSTVEINKGSMNKFFRRWIGDGLVTVDEPKKWHRNRRMITPTFHFGKLEEYVQVMDTHSKRLVEFLEPKANGEVVDICNIIKMSALDIIVEAAMGQQLNALEHSDQPYVKAVDDFSHLAYIQFVKPFIKLFWYPGGYETKTKHCEKLLKGKTEKVIQERLKLRKDTVEYKRRPDFLDMLLNEGEASKLTVEEIREEVDTFMFAGHDTTAHALSWTLWALATHPKIQERLYEEIAVNFPDKYSVTDFKTKDLKYFDAVIKESMRLFPPVPIFQRRLANDVVIGKHTVPKGAELSIAPFFLHHNHTVFPEHTKFDPENFLNDRELESNAYIPFSSGPRNCIGQKFAMYEIKIVLIHLLLNYKFSTDYALHDNIPKLEIMLKPSLGVPVRIEKRF